MLAIALATTACVELDGPVPDPPAAQVQINEDVIIGMVSHYRDATVFDKISETPYPSALTGTAYIALYSSRDATTDFEPIAPEYSGSQQSIPAGGVVVREVLDTDMNPLRLTVMAKGPAGYNTRLGDWYFAVTDLHGIPLLGTDGQPRSGRMVDCFGCHVPRASDDFLFGVPMDDRSTSDSGSTTP